MQAGDLVSFGTSLALRPSMCMLHKGFGEETIWVPD